MFYKLIVLLAVLGCAPSMSKDIVGPTLGCSFKGEMVWGFGYESYGNFDRIIAKGTWKQFTQDSVSNLDQYGYEGVDFKFWIERTPNRNGFFVVYMEGTVDGEPISEDWVMWPSGPCRWKSSPDPEKFVYVFIRTK